MASYLGIDLGGTNIRAVAVTAAGELLAQHRALTRAQEGPEAVIARLVEAARWLQGQVGPAAAIGIGAPGPLDLEHGLVLTAPHLPGWERLPLRQILAEELGIPCALENDANAAAIGEHRHGAGQGVRHLLYVGLGTGIGGGIIIDGRIYHGAVGGAGEVGHMAIALDGPRCDCGRVGCWEAFASGSALERRAAALVAAGEAPGLAHRLEEASLTAELVAAAAADGDAVAQALLAETGRYVGIGLGNLANLLDPERIIVGGGLSQAGPLLWRPALAALGERAFRRPPVLAAGLGDWSGAFGAAAIAREAQGL